MSLQEIQKVEKEKGILRFEKKKACVAMCNVSPCPSEPRPRKTTLFTSCNFHGCEKKKSQAQFLAYMHKVHCFYFFSFFLAYLSFFIPCSQRTPKHIPIQHSTLERSSMNSLSQIPITCPSGTTSTTGISSSFFFLPCVAVWRERIERAAHSFLLSFFTLSLNCLPPFQNLSFLLFCF